MEGVFLRENPSIYGWELGVPHDYGNPQIHLLASLSFSQRQSPAVRLLESWQAGYGLLSIPAWREPHITCPNQLRVSQRSLLNGQLLYFALSPLWITAQAQPQLLSFNWGLNTCSAQNLQRIFPSTPRACTRPANEASCDWDSMWSKVGEPSILGRGLISSV